MHYFIVGNSATMVLQVEKHYTDNSNEGVSFMSLKELKN